MQQTTSPQPHHQQQTHQTMPLPHQLQTPDPTPSHPSRRVSKFTEIFTETRIVDPFNPPPSSYSYRHQDSRSYMAKTGAELAFSITLRQLSPSQIHTRNPIPQHGKETEGPFSRLAGWDEEDRAVQTTEGRAKGREARGPLSRLAEWEDCGSEKRQVTAEEERCNGKKGRIGRWLSKLKGL